METPVRPDFATTAVRLAEILDWLNQAFEELQSTHDPQPDAA